MNRRREAITGKIRDEILARSANASSRDEITRAIFDAIVEITRAIFDAIVEDGVDWKTVSPDDVKPVLVEAVRAASGKQVRRAHPIPVVADSPGLTQIAVG